MAGKRQVERVEKPPLMCASAGCPYDARVRVQFRKAQMIEGRARAVPFGPWLNLCLSCDDKRHRHESREYCELMGLDTPAKQKAWCLQNFKRGKDMLKPLQQTLREPGQDEDEFLDMASQA